MNNEDASGIGSILLTGDSEMTLLCLSSSSSVNSNWPSSSSNYKNKNPVNKTQPCILPVFGWKYKKAALFGHHLWLLETADALWPSSLTLDPVGPLTRSGNALGVHVHLWSGRVLLVVFVFAGDLVAVFAIRLAHWKLRRLGFRVRVKKTHCKRLIGLILELLKIGTFSNLPSSYWSYSSW